MNETARKAAELLARGLVTVAIVVLNTWDTVRYLARSSR